MGFLPVILMGVYRCSRFDPLLNYSKFFQNLGTYDMLYLNSFKIFKMNQHKMRVYLGIWDRRSRRDYSLYEIVEGIGVNASLP